MCFAQAASRAMERIFQAERIYWSKFEVLQKTE